MDEIVERDEVEAILFSGGVTVREAADLFNIRPCLHHPTREAHNRTVVEPKMLRVLVHGYELLRSNKLNEERRVILFTHRKHFVQVFAG